MNLKLIQIRDFGTVGDTQVVLMSPNMNLYGN